MRAIFRAFAIGSFIWLAYAAHAEPIAPSADQSMDGDAIALRARATGANESVLGLSTPLVVIIAAGVLGALVVANAIAEINADGTFGAAVHHSRGMSAEHLFLPITVRTPGSPDFQARLISLSKRHFAFLSPAEISRGAQVFIAPKPMMEGEQTQQWFHGVVAARHGDAKDGGTCEIEGRLIAESGDEAAKLLEWIASLGRAALPVPS